MARRGGVAGTKTCETAPVVLSCQVTEPGTEPPAYRVRHPERTAAVPDAGVLRPLLALYPHVAVLGLHQQLRPDLAGTRLQTDKNRNLLLTFVRFLSYTIRQIPPPLAASPPWFPSASMGKLRRLEALTSAYRDDDYKTTRSETCGDIYFIAVL